LKAGPSSKMTSRPEAIQRLIVFALKAKAKRQNAAKI
jgi:hypothetical protein